MRDNSIFTICLFVICFQSWLPLDSAAAMSVNAAKLDEDVQTNGIEQKQLKTSSSRGIGESSLATNGIGYSPLSASEDDLTSLYGYDDSSDVAKRRLRASKRRLRESKRRLRESKRRLRFHKREQAFADPADFPEENMERAIYERDLREPRLRFHDIRKRSATSAAAAHGKAESGQSHQHSLNRRSVITDLRDIGNAVRAKRQLSIGNHLSSLTDLIVAEEQRRLARERELLRQRLLKAGKRSDLSFAGSSGVLDDDNRDVITLLESTLK